MSNYGEVIMAETSTQFKWIVQYSDCCKLTKKEKLISPIFLTIIKNTVHNWQFSVLPSKDMKYLYFYVQNLTKRNVKVTVQLGVHNILIPENKRKLDSFYEPLTQDKNSGYDSWGVAIIIKPSNEPKNAALLVTCKIIPAESIMFSPRSQDARGFETLLDDEKYSDVTFTVDNKVIKAHKCILTKKSDVFAAMFEHDTIEKKQNVVEITDISYNVFKEMLRFLYGGKIDNMKNVAADLLPVANKYLLEELKTICEEFLSANLNVENVIEYVCLADTHNANVLETEAIQFLLSNAKSVMDKPELKSLSQSHPEVMCNVFRALSRKKFRSD